MCSLSSIADVFTTSARQTVADSRGATPVLTESGGAFAGEDRGVRISTIFCFFLSVFSLQVLFRSERSAKSLFQE